MAPQNSSESETPKGFYEMNMVSESRGNQSIMLSFMEVVWKFGAMVF